MSTEKGNGSRTRPQKYKNRAAFKNDLHDTSHVRKAINNIQVKDVCLRCKEIIDWKIKYKKYKPLSQPKKCVRCDQKNIKQAYHIMCTQCSRKFEVCAKCCKSKEIVNVPPDKEEQLKLDLELKQLLQTLPERKRRTFMRYLNKKPAETEATLTRDDLVQKLNVLKMNDDPSSSDYSDEDQDSDF